MENSIVRLRKRLNAGRTLSTDRQALAAAYLEYIRQELLAKQAEDDNINQSERSDYDVEHNL